MKKSIRGSTAPAHTPSTRFPLRCTPVRPMAWLAAAVFTLSCKYFYEAIMAEDDDEDHGKRE